MARLMTQLVKCTARSLLFGHETNFIVASKSMKSASLVRHIATTHRAQADRRYTDKHEWIIVNGNVGTVGISDYAQSALGDVVYAELPDVQSIVKKDEECGALESVKAASDIMSPCSGKVIEKNTAVESKPGLINTSCYDDGWLFKIELTEPEEINTLMNEDAYNEFLKTDPH